MENEISEPERIECANRICKWTGTEDDYVWVPNGGPLNSKTATCPQCGKNAFYHPDKLMEWQKKLIASLQAALAESPELDGVSAAQVVPHYNRYRSHQFVRGKLVSLAKWGHVVEIEGPPSRWKLPTPKSDEQDVQQSVA